MKCVNLTTDNNVISLLFLVLHLWGHLSSNMVKLNYLRIRFSYVHSLFPDDWSWKLRKLRHNVCSHYDRRM